MLLLEVGHRDNVTTIRGELPAQEEVHEKELEEDVDKVEELACKECVGIELVVVAVLQEVVNQNLFPVLLLIFVDHGNIHVLDQHVHSARLRHFPEIPRRGKDASDEEYDTRNLGT